jgi:hypothetical protein
MTDGLYQHKLASKPKTINAQAKPITGPKKPEPTPTTSPADNSTLALRQEAATAAVFVRAATITPAAIAAAAVTPAKQPKRKL